MLKSLLLAGAALTLATLSVSAQQFIELPPGTWCHDITPDGSTVVGTAGGGGFFWNWRTEPALTLIGGGTAVAVSDDGTVVAGNTTDPGTGAQVAGRWTQAGGWEIIGGLDQCGSISSAYDISADGDRVVGLAWNGCSGRGFLYTFSTGILELEGLVNGNNRASAISGDGSNIGGFAQGSFTRTPALWDPSSLAGFVFDPDYQGEVHGFNEDGSTYVGTNFITGVAQGAMYGDAINGLISIGSLNNGWTGNAYDITESGDLIVGFDVNGLSREAWVWTEATGIVALTDVLTSIGAPASISLAVCLATSDDGSVVVGGGGGFPGIKGFIAELSPGTQAWTDLGGGTNGINGVPHLSGTGQLVAGTPTNIDLVNGPSSAPSLIWVSLTSVPFPVFGGTIHANPFVSEFLIPLNGAGEFHAAFPWFAGVPSGLELNFQFLIQDLSIFWGITLSNGLRATAP